MNPVQRSLQVAGRPGYASGGAPSQTGANIANNVTGGLASPVPGRTDHLPISVPDGAYVIPADVVSALGQGNTQAGFKKLERQFGVPAPAAPGQPVNIMAAGGEFIVSPTEVMKLGNGDTKSGHDVLDAWVKLERKDAIAKMKRIPGPRKT